MQRKRKGKERSGDEYNICTRVYEYRKISRGAAESATSCFRMCMRLTSGQGQGDTLSLRRL